jgi:predicted ABC-type ATPase
MGGHDVPRSLVESRYYRSLNLLKDAFLSVDRAFIIDSSNRNRNLVIEKIESELQIKQDVIPGWVDQYLLKRLKLKY